MQSIWKFQYRHIPIFFDSHHLEIIIRTIEEIFLCSTSLFAILTYLHANIFSCSRSLSKDLILTYPALLQRLDDSV
jgi:hypothetical protein